MPNSTAQPVNPPSSQGSLGVTVQVEALAAAWRRGERLAVEDVLRRSPVQRTEAAIRLIYEEVSLRREAGEEVATAEVVGRFPQWKSEIELIFGCDRLLGPRVAARFPEVGESLGPFRLLAELGRGASGRTFLAAQLELADRPVVLKVIPSDQEEHLSLARLQHTHIVPLFAEQSFPECGLRALCMPYLGGTSFSRLLDTLADIPPPQRRGWHLVEALDAHSQPGATGFGGPFRRSLEQATYVEAVCWIGACLADALAYAHDRGLLHMDIKPSNVLVTGDGQPMLLDFHLARGPIAPGAWMYERLGGTPGWMSPEQQAALSAVNEGRGIPLAVDGRSDLFALGMLMREALGQGAKQPGTRLRSLNPAVSVGLEEIIKKCTAREASERYPNASALADDLRRHLNHLPLRGVPNRSLTERWSKWQKRRSGSLTRAAAVWTTVAALSVTLGLAGSFYVQRVREVEAVLKDARRFVAEHQYDDALRRLDRGFELARWMPATDRLKHALDAAKARAERGRKASKLHELADLIRYNYGLTPPSRDEAQRLIHDIRAIWQERDRLVQNAGAPLDLKTEAGVRTDLLELALVWADFRVRFAAPEERAAASAEALRVLDEARELADPSPALDRERQALAAALGIAPSLPRPVPEPKTAWEHYDLGRSYLRTGQIEQASREFQRTLDKKEDDFWPNFYFGRCAFLLGRFEEAVAAFGKCIVLDHDQAGCHYNRALAFEKLGRTEAAIHDYDRALELDPHLTAAALNRGILAYKAGRLKDAIADFQHAIGSAADASTRGLIHYNLALAYLDLGDHESALKNADLAVQEGEPNARTLRDRLRRSR